MVIFSIPNETKKPRQFWMPGLFHWAQVGQSMSWLDFRTLTRVEKAVSLELFLDLSCRLRKASPRPETIHVYTVLFDLAIQRTARQAMFAGDGR